MLGFRKRTELFQVESLRPLLWWSVESLGRQRLTRCLYPYVLDALFLSIPPGTWLVLLESLHQAQRAALPVGRPVLPVCCDLPACGPEEQLLLFSYIPTAVCCSKEPFCRH